MATESIVASTELRSDHFHKWVIVESIIILTTGLTSFISLIFIPRSIPYFLALSIFNGIFGISCGSTGLYFSCKVCLKLLKLLWALLLVVGTLNLISSGTAAYLLITQILYSKPDCNDCSYDKFIYAAHIIYFIIQVFADLFLAYLVYLELKHSLLYKRNKESELHGISPSLKINST